MSSFFPLTMNAQTMISSPTSVIQTNNWENKQILLEFPDLISQSRKRVRFSSKPAQEIASEATIEEVASLWLTKAETYQIALEAKRAVKSFQKHSNPEACDAVLELFQECSRPKTNSLYVSENAQTILYSETPVRGLERLMNSELKKARVYHVQSLLKIQGKCNSSSACDQSCRLEILRYRSLQTSKGSRALARIFAHGDELQVVSAMQFELFGASSQF